jgi:hypothetical protein
MHLLKTIQIAAAAFLLATLMQQIPLNWCEIEKEYTDIADDAKEHAKWYIDNLGKIAHQREIDLLFWVETWMIYDKNLGTKNYIKTIVQCTIKVKVGIDKSKEIKNPYYGLKMLTVEG